MARVEGLEQVLVALSQRVEAMAPSPKVTVNVGYTQDYAIHVHEDLEARHPVGKAKFLEDPAKRLGPELGAMVDSLIRQGIPLPQALLLAGLRLQRESQAECPVDTGALRASAFTEIASEDQ